MNAMTDPAYFAGQALGLLSTACAIARPLQRSKGRILGLNIAVNALVAANYILIGRPGSASALCMVAIVQSVVSLFHHTRKTAVSTGETILFAALYLGFGLTGMVTAPGFVWALTPENLLDLLPIGASLTLMAAVFTPKEQATRKLLLVNGVIWTGYALAVGSSTFLTNFVSAAAAGAALLKYRRPQP